MIELFYFILFFVCVWDVFLNNDGMYWRDCQLNEYSLWKYWYEIINCFRHFICQDNTHFTFLYSNYWYWIINFVVFLCLCCLNQTTLFDDTEHFNLHPIHFFNGIMYFSSRYIVLIFYDLILTYLVSPLY